MATDTERVYQKYCSEREWTKYYCDTRTQKSAVSFAKGSTAGNSRIASDLIAMRAAPLFMVLQPRCSPVGDGERRRVRYLSCVSLPERKYWMWNAPVREIVQNLKRSVVLRKAIYVVGHLGLSGDVGCIGEPLLRSQVVVLDGEVAQGIYGWM